MTVHDLKCEQRWFHLMRDGAKRFEVRWDDRAFQPADTLRLCEWDGEGYTGAMVRMMVVYRMKLNEVPGLEVIDGHGTEGEWVVLGLAPCVGLVDPTVRTWVHRHKGPITGVATRGSDEEWLQILTDDGTIRSRERSLMTEVVEVSDKALEKATTAFNDAEAAFHNTLSALRECAR